MKLPLLVVALLIALLPLISQASDKIPLPRRPGYMKDDFNPYHDKYTYLDYWASMNYRAGLDSDYDAPTFLSPDEGPRPISQMLGEPLTLTFVLDENGRQIPFTEAFEQQAEREKAAFDRSFTVPVRQLYLEDYARRKAGLRTDEWLVPELGQQLFFATGYATPELFAAAKQQYADYLAELFPPIPAWIGEQPPLTVVFLPDGNILCCGGLGQRYQYEDRLADHPEAPGYFMYEGDPWYRYTPDGRLLESIPCAYNTSWKDPIFGYDKKLQPARSQYRESQRISSAPALLDSIRVFTDSAIYLDQPGAHDSLPIGPAPEPHLAFDWDGTPLDLDQPRPAHPLGTCTPIGGGQLSGIYRAQLALGKTSADSVSPYAGTPNGPVLALSTNPQPLPNHALCISTSTFSLIAVRPLDDPANPFSAEYGQWERWAYPGLGDREPHDWVAAADLWSAGEHPPTEEPPLASLRVYFDAQGFMLPFEQAWQREFELNGRIDYRSNELYTNGDNQSSNRDALWWQKSYVLGSEAIQLKHYERSERMRRYPPVPDWVDRQAQLELVFLPDGRVCTFNGDWNLFSADGRLLKTVTSAKSGNAYAEWLPLTFPGYAAFKKREAAVGHDLAERGGYLLVRDSPDTKHGTLGQLLGRKAKLTPAERKLKAYEEVESHLIAAYDYNGTPLPLDKPLLRASGYCERLDQEMIKAGRRERSAVEN